MTDNTEKVYFVPPEPEEVDRPRGRFLEGYFYWVPSREPGLEDEWGLQVIATPGDPLETHGSLYMPTGNTRLRAAQ